LSFNMFAFLTKASKGSQLRERKILDPATSIQTLARQAQRLSLDLPRKSQRRNLKKYKDCVDGEAVCQWLVDSGMSPDVSHAAQLAMEFLCNGFITDVCGKNVFRNSGLYRFDDDHIHNVVHSQSPESMSSDLCLSPTIDLIEDSPEMSCLVLDYDVEDQLRMASFDTDDLAITPPSDLTQSTSKMATRGRGHPVVQPLTRSMPMLIDKHSKKRPSSIYRDHHNRGNRLMVTASEPIVPRIALFASTTEHTPEPLAYDAQEMCAQSDVESMPSPRHKSTDFDLPDIHALESSISHIEFMDDSLELDCASETDPKPRFVFTHVSHEIGH